VIYRIEWRPRARKAFLALDKPVRRRIGEAVDALAGDPRRAGASMPCVPLWVDERCLGALGLYVDQVAAFTELHERVMTLLATFAAVALALAEGQRAEQLREALGTRDVIGQAKGILVERHGIATEAAFGVLARVSQAENTKLAEIACRLAETRKLPPRRA
jgi:GAF domain-containing protein